MRESCLIETTTVDDSGWIEVYHRRKLMIPFKKSQLMRIRKTDLLREFSHIFTKEFIVNVILEHGDVGK